MFFLKLAIVIGVRWYLIVVLHSLMTRYVEHLPMCLLAIQIDYSVLLNFLTRFLIFFYVELYDLFLYVGYQPIISHIIWKNILSSRFSFHFVSGFLCCAKAFKFNGIQFDYFCFHLLCFSRWIQKCIDVIYVRECSTCVLL